MELALYAMLDEMGVEYLTEWNVPGTRYRVDAYVEVRYGEVGRGAARHGRAWQGKGNTAFEADGPTHHTPKGRKHDKIRDARILASGYVNQIVRLGYRELREWI